MKKGGASILSPEEQYKEALKRMPVLTMRTSRLEVKWQSNEPCFEMQACDMFEVREAQRVAAEKQGLQPYYLRWHTPDPGLKWNGTHEDVHLGHFFQDLQQEQMYVIDAYSYTEEKPKTFRGQETVMVDVIYNVLVYQRLDQTAFDFIAQNPSVTPNTLLVGIGDVIKELSASGFKYLNVFMNRNQSPKGDWWRGDTINLSKPTSRPRIARGLRINGNSYALESAPELPPPSRPTLEERVAKVVDRLQGHPDMQEELRKLRSRELRMASATALGLDPAEMDFEIQSSVKSAT